jgi:hypothetical protein
VKVPVHQNLVRQYLYFNTFEHVGNLSLAPTGTANILQVSTCIEKNILTVALVLLEDNTVVLQH